MASFASLILVFGVFLIRNADADRFLDKMYTNIESSICFRRLNATHATGCGSLLGGSVGVLHVIEVNHDFEFVINSPPAPPYTLVVPPRLFTRENVLNLTQKAAHNIAGIVVIENRTSVLSFSHESRCPNEYGGLVQQQTCDRNDPTRSWNPYGTGLLHENFPFPIIYVKDSKYIANITDCFRKFNAFDRPNQHKRSLCAIQIKSFMSAAVNSEVCMRRTKNVGTAVNPPRYCDPLQGKNIYATLFPRTKVATMDKQDTKTNEEIIVIATRIDTTSMFDGLGLGALDSLVPAVTLMSIAHTLAKMFANDTDFARPNILFMFFNGEAYDYIGSQRFVYDMERGDFPSAASQTQPIRLENIKFFIDIGSLDSLNSTTIYRYNDFKVAKDFAHLMSAYNDKMDFHIVINQNKTHSLPPTSAQTFLRDNQTFPAVILYSEKDKNRFYHSIYDDVKNINFVYKNTSKDFSNLIDFTTLPPDFPADSIQSAIRNYSTVIAFTVHEMVTAIPYTQNLGANPYLIDEMLHCYLESGAKCPLFQASVKDPKVLEHAQPKPLQRYISVESAMALETIAWTYSVLGFLTGRPVSNHVADNCTQLPLAWYAGFDGKGQCYLTTQNFSSALSPAFISDDYDWKSGRYSTWTESTWSEINVRIFVKPPVSQEAFTLVIGFAVLLISFLIVFIINSKSDVLFGESTASINVLTLPAQC